MPKPDTSVTLTIEGHAVRISNPIKPYFARETHLTKLDIVNYFQAVAPGALLGIRDRPIVLKRFVDGAVLPDKQPEPFYQKRAPADLPPFLRTVTLSFPSGRTADEVVVDNAAGLAWIANLGCIELHPHPVRSAALDHPDELRIDLDPVPGIGWPDIQRTAQEVHALLTEHALTPYIKTSGSRGIHINVRIHPQWTFTEVRRAALAVSRAIERRLPGIATSKWWKEERHGVFLDYNQNAKDRTTASAYSVRPLPDARVSAPIHWHELPDLQPRRLHRPHHARPFRHPRRPARRYGRPRRFPRIPLLELAARDEAEGLGDAPWPPHFAKGESEPARVAPSKAKRAKSFGSQLNEGFGAHRFRRQSGKLTAAPSTGSNGSTAEAPTPRKPRASTRPLLTIGQSPDKSAAEAGLARWKAANAEAAAHLQEADILTDRMRGSACIWYRIRINLEHVPADLRPAQAPLDPDVDPTR